MNYQALAKRSKKTELNEYGKYKKKKRFGKSINDRSPGYFIKLLEDKCIRYDIEFNKINTQNVKASQYNHLTNSYEKYKLNDRIKLIGTNIVQRDLYSAYIIKNVKKDLETIDKRKKRKDFNKFLEIQEKEINRIKSQGIKNKNFGI